MSNPLKSATGKFSYLEDQNELNVILLTFLLNQPLCHL